MSIVQNILLHNVRFNTFVCAEVDFFLMPYDSNRIKRNESLYKFHFAVVFFVKFCYNNISKPHEGVFV